MIVNHIIEMINITRSYPGVLALKNVSVAINKGKILGLVGENGAGKSTLMKILCGADQPDQGEILIEGEKVILSNPRTAREYGIFMVQQELSLIPPLRVVDNIVLGEESKKTYFNILRNKENLSKAKEALNIIGLNINPNQKVSELDIATQQMIEIARNLIQKPKVLILDEPTAALSVNETKRLLNILKNLRDKGVAIIFISHKLDEVIQIADDITVMRDGMNIGTVPAKSVDRNKLISMMIGQEIEEQIPQRSSLLLGKKILVVDKASVKGKFSNISFEVHAGEVIGMFGLKGSGRSDVAMAIFGAIPLDEGKIIIKNREEKFKSPKDAINSGVGFLSEDRKTLGLFLGLSVKNNISISNMSEISNKRGVIFSNKENIISNEFIQRLSIKTPTEKQKVRFLSGGNQQKVLIARWLFKGCDLLILDEPTKGIDVKAKHEIYMHIHELALNQKGILMISSEIEEILAICDKVIIMKSGIISAILNREEATRELLMHYAAG